MIGRVTGCLGPGSETWFQEVRGEKAESWLEEGDPNPDSSPWDPNLVREGIYTKFP